MDDSRFAVWTRRRLGPVAAGFVVALRGLAARGAAAGKKKRRRKTRCRRLGQVCSGRGKRRCCNTLRCGSLFEAPGRRCCRGRGAPCSSGGGECCLDHLCVIEVGSAQGVCGLF